MVNVGNWVAESTLSTGTGDVVLNGAEPGFVRFLDAIPSGEVWYSIVDGSNREAGIGVFNGLNVIARSSIAVTFLNGVYNDSNPLPITLSGAAIISCTFNSSAYRDLLNHIESVNNPHDVVANQVGYDSAGDPITDADDLQDATFGQSYAIEQRVSSMSGVHTGGFLSGTGSLFSIIDGTGEVYDSYTVPGNTTEILVSWTGKSNITLQISNPNAGRTYIFITTAGNVLQINDSVNPSHFRDNIFLGIIFYINSFITDVTNAPVIVKQTATDFHDFNTNEIQLTGVNLRPVDNALQIWREEGTALYPGVNWYNDVKNPNVFTIVQSGDENTPITLTGFTQDGAIGDDFITIPELYNPSANTLVALNGDNATIHRIYSLGAHDPRFMLLYGQNSYDNATEAKENFFLDDGNTLFPPEVGSMYFLGYVCVSNNSPDFNDVDDAWIVSQSHESGGASSSGGASNDHTILVNRDANDQHPISSIIGLQTELDGKADTIAGGVEDNLASIDGVENIKDSSIPSVAVIRSDVTKQVSVGYTSNIASYGTSNTIQPDFTLPSFAQQNINGNVTVMKPAVNNGSGSLFMRIIPQSGGPFTIILDTGVSLMGDLPILETGKQYIMMGLVFGGGNLIVQFTEEVF